MAFQERGLPHDFIEQVKTANNIVSVAGRYMMLKQKGRNHWACCPFHHEKTPSFAINEQTQVYHCFGCGVGGNVITLVREMENVDFIGAVELLAKWAGLNMPKVTSDPKYAETARKKQKTLEIVEAAREFYCSHLCGSPADYLHSRGITDELIKMFNIGLSPDWDSLLKHLKTKGYTDDQIFEAGVSAKNDRGGFYDAMGGRITFSIFDIYNNCIGFTGRIIPEKDTGTVAKYRNTAQTIVFDKGNIVYGIDVFKAAKRSQVVEKLIVVEGNVDVITLVGAGFSNTVACMGTAMTPYHAKIFKRLCTQVYLCFDGDGAGRKASLRSLDILAAENLMVRVVELPDDADPDDFVKKNGAEGFQKLLDAAKPMIDYKLDTIAAAGNLRDNLGKTEYLKNATAVLREVRDPAAVELYAPKVAAAAGVSPESVLRSVASAAAKNSAPTSAKNSAQTSVQASAQNAKETVPIAAPNKKYISALIIVTASKINGREFAARDFHDEIADILRGCPQYSPEKFKIEIDNKLYAEAMKHKISDIYDLFDEDDKIALAPVLEFDFTNDEQSLAKQYLNSVECLIENSLKKFRARLVEQSHATDDLAEQARISIENDSVNKIIRYLKTRG